MDLKNRIEKEIEYYRDEAIKTLESDVEWFKSLVNEMAKRYKKLVEELEELPKLTDEEIIFAHTIELSHLPISVDRFGDKVIVRSPKREYEIPIPWFENGLKVKIILYKEKEPEKR